jgi:peroxiredoxin/putative methionine-R-sulfoxide reductase with GAF domain
MSDAWTQISEIVAGEEPREAKASAIAEAIRVARDYRWVGMYDVGADEVEIVSCSGGDLPAHPSFGVGQGLTGEAIAQARPVLADVTTSTAYLPTFGDTKSELIVPILARGAVRGTIDVESSEADAFSEADIAFLEGCASAAAPLWEVAVEYELPPDLPAPVDDGACGHLAGRGLPSLVLDSTHDPVDLAELAQELLVLYVYPRAGGPNFRPSEGWDAVPGARGCTPESCSFRDHAAEFGALGARVAGLSAQPLDEQIELAQRLHLPFRVIADPERELGRELGLPTFVFEGATLYKRLTLVCERRRIVKVFYPVFPPDRHGDEVLAWLRQR